MRKPRVLNIRGTSGSGKSTLARELMKGYRRMKPVTVEGRKQPLYYLLSEHPERPFPLVVLGHYNTACGGCDTITDQDRIYQLAQQHLDNGCDVLMEGLLISAEFNRAESLNRTRGCLFVLQIDIPLEQCIASVEARRRERGDERPLNPKNTTSKYKGVKKTCERLAAAGVPVVTGPRELIKETAERLLSAEGV